MADAKYRHGHRWTNDELKRLIALWLEGAELDFIAEIMGTTRFAVNKMVLRLRRDGIPLPRRTRGHKAGRRNTPWTQSEIEYLVRRCGEGITGEQIAQELDRTIYGIQGMIYKLRDEGINLRLRGRGKRRLWDTNDLQAAIVGRGIRALGEEDDRNIVPFKAAI